MPDSPDPTIAISIRQPWAHLIIHGRKPVENRTWATKFRGPVWIHAGKGMTKDEYREVVRFTKELFGHSIVPPARELEFGGIVGKANLVDCVQEMKSEWFFGPWGFVLENAEPVSFKPCRGALGFFRPSFD